MAKAIIKPKKKRQYTCLYSDKKIWVKNKILYDPRTGIKYYLLRPFDKSDKTRLRCYKFPSTYRAYIRMEPPVYIVNAGGSVLSDFILREDEEYNRVDRLNKKEQDRQNGIIKRAIKKMCEEHKLSERELCDKFGCINVQFLMRMMKWCEWKRVRKGEEGYIYES